MSAEAQTKSITAIICSGIVAAGLIVAADRVSTLPRFVPLGSANRYFVFDREAKQVCWSGPLSRVPDGITPCYRSHAFTTVDDVLGLNSR